MKKLVALLLAVVVAFGLTACSMGSDTTPVASQGTSASAGTESETSVAPDAGTTAKTAETGKDLNFVIIPKCVHEWFDAVNQGAQQQAKVLSEQLGVNVNVDYRAPSSADVTEQNTILEQAAATMPSGIALDPVDYEGSKAIIEEIQNMGIPVMLFDAVVDGSGLSSVGNDFAEQATLEAKKLVELLGGKGKVAVMHGVTTAATHIERYDAHMAVLKQYPDIQIIDGGASSDDVQTAQQQAAAVIAANPDLAGYLCVDGAAPIGISAAIEEAGKQGQITFVGAENLAQILQYIKDGTIVCSYSTMPQMQGSMAVLMMWEMSVGQDIPAFVDTGILYIDKNNVDEWISIVNGDK